ncbi:hypothetical protein MCEMRH37_00033 [Candidatus Nanopelagicaceae bacterium]
MNAIYLRNRLDRNFQLFYFPHSTGTFWPFGIDFLLEEGELASSEVEIRGLEGAENLEIGKIIKSHPLAARRFSYERVLSILRRLNLERFLQKLRGEDALLAKRKNLDKVSSKSRAVSGGFVPIADLHVNAEMDRRFLKAGVRSPFSISLEESMRPDVVIHFRIGDKRAKFSHPSDFGGDGICDPNVFSSITNSLKTGPNPKIIVVSDEPKVAQALLREAGLNVETNPVTGNLWDDLYLMSQARVFVGSWSQVSQLAAICVSGNKGKAFLPSTTQVGTKIKWQVDGVTFYDPEFLEEEHWIYSDNFSLDEDAHGVYRKS